VKHGILVIETQEFMVMMMDWRHGKQEMHLQIMKYLIFLGQVRFIKIYLDTNSESGCSKYHFQQMKRIRIQDYGLIWGTSFMSWESILLESVWFKKTWTFSMMMKSINRKKFLIIYIASKLKFMQGCEMINIYQK